MKGDSIFIAELNNIAIGNMKNLNDFCLNGKNIHLKPNKRKSIMNRNTIRKISISKNKYTI